MSLVGGYAQNFAAPSPADPLYAAAAAYYSSPTGDGPYYQAWLPADVSPAEYSPGSYGLSPAPSDFLPVEKGGQCLSGGLYEPRVRGVKRRVTANRKERRRTLSINTAFAELRERIPNVPSDTKLSKIKTLRLATSYIAYLMDILARDDPSAIPDGGFKAELGRKLDSRDERRKKECMATMLGSNGSITDKKGKGRTGWPQHVWALELKQ